MLHHNEISSPLSKKEKIEHMLWTLWWGIERWPKFDQLGNFNRLVICGSSLSWKSTIATMFRNHDYNWTKFDTVHRYTTRPSRKWKNQSAENSNVENDFFHQLQQEGHIIYWQREMEKNGENQRRVMYWFHSDDIVQTFREMDWNERNNDTTYIYSGNNDFIRRMWDDMNSNVKQFEDETLILYVDAPEEVRKERMQTREDNMLVNKPQEAQYRLSDSWDDVKACAHLVVKNYWPHEWRTLDNIEKFIQVLFGE